MTIKLETTAEERAQVKARPPAFDGTVDDQAAGERWLAALLRDIDTLLAKVWDNA